MDDTYKDVTAHCFDCRKPWVIRGTVMRQAYGLLVSEYPQGALIALPSSLDYLCEDCQLKRQVAQDGKRSSRRTKKRVH